MTRRPPHHATILPLPTNDVPEGEYLANLLSRMQDHLKIVTERFGADAARQLIKEIAS